MAEEARFVQHRRERRAPFSRQSKRNRFRLILPACGHFLESSPLFTPVPILVPAAGTSPGCHPVLSQPIIRTPASSASVELARTRRSGSGNPFPQTGASFFTANPPQSLCAHSATPAIRPTAASPDCSDASPKASAPIRISALIPPSTATSASSPTAGAAPAARASARSECKPTWHGHPARSLFFFIQKSKFNTHQSSIHLTPPSPFPPPPAPASHARQVKDAVP